MLKFRNSNDITNQIYRLRMKIQKIPTQQSIFKRMELLPDTLIYENVQQLAFELELREEIVEAAIALSKSEMAFSVFQKSRCNTRYWKRNMDGGFVNLSQAKPSDCILDIYQQGKMYATECATAMVIVYYKACLMVYGEERFNALFPHISLMNWSDLDKSLELAGMLTNTTYYLPGDRRYFANPDVSYQNLAMQGENVIQLMDSRFYGHDIGVVEEQEIIDILNRARKRNASRSAYLKDTVGRLDFQHLYSLTEN